MTKWFNQVPLKREALISLLWLAGFVFALMPFPAYEGEAFGLTFLIICMAAIISLWYGHIRWPTAPLPRTAIMIAGAFWGLAFISAFLSGVFYISFIYFCYFSVFPLTVIIVLLQNDKMLFYKTICAGLAIIFALLSTAALLQSTLFPAMLMKGLVHWPLANPNALGALFSLGFYGALSGVFMLKTPTQKWTSTALALLIFAALLTTGSRGAFLSLLCGTTLAAACLWPAIKTNKTYLITLLLGALLAFFILHIGVTESAKPMSEVAVRTVTGKEKLLWERPQIWHSTWRIIQDHMWTGTGIGTFFLYYPAYRDGDFTTAGRAAHSDPLQFWSEMGALAPLLFYGFILCMITLTVKIRKNKKIDTRRSVFIFMFFALFSMTLHTHITFNFYVLSCLMMVGLYLASWGITLKTDNKTLNNNKIISYTSILAIIGTLSVFALFHGAQLSVNHARTALKNNDLERFATHINHAHTLSGGRHAGAYILASSHTLGVLNSAQTLGLPRQEVNRLYQQNLNYTDKAHALNPRLASALYARAMTIMIGQDLGITPAETPARLLDQALALDPLHVKARIVRADLYMDSGDPHAALEIMKQGLRWAYQRQNPAYFYQKVAALATKLGDQDTTLHALRKLGQLGQR